MVVTPRRFLIASKKRPAVSEVQMMAELPMLLVRLAGSQSDLMARVKLVKLARDETHPLFAIAIFFEDGVPLSVELTPHKVAQEGEHVVLHSVGSLGSFDSFITVVVRVTDILRAFVRFYTRL